jgi:quercetin dioxygenase-like cupin family protein
MEKGGSKIFFIPETELGSKNHLGNYQAPLPSAKAFQILELVNYQVGSIVSRTLSNGKCGSITLFAFDQGQGLTEHTSPFDALLQILEGKAEIFVSGKRMEANGGEVVILPANQPHALNALSKFKMLLTMIRSPG